MLKISILDLSSKITDLGLQLYLPGVNEFTYLHDMLGLFEALFQ